MATVTVLYPAGELDLDYYMNKHVPLVAEYESHVIYYIRKS
jgi:hypothetical protein